ncbi:Lactate utilization protein [Trichinella pseudospiralis]
MVVHRINNAQQCTTVLGVDEESAHVQKEQAPDLKLVQNKYTLSQSKRYLKPQLQHCHLFPNHRHGTVQQGNKCIKTCVCSFKTTEPDIGNRWISTCAACPLEYPWTKRGDHHS